MPHSLDHLRLAYESTRRAVRETPLLEAPRLASRLGAQRVLVKPESLQVAGSFKIRGAYWRLTRLDADARERGVVAFSSGNFAQGLAAAGAALGVPVTIVMPADAPANKREATESLGATVVLSEHGERPREEVAAERARQLAADQGLTLLHPFDDPEVVAGQAGAGLEAIAQLEALDARADVVACSVGGGGLVAGVALAFHHLSPATRVFAVEPVGYDAMGESLRRGERTRVASGEPTICDALQATAPGEATFPVARDLGVTGVAVADDAVTVAMREAFDELKLVLEPSGAIALAAVIRGAIPVAGKTVLVFATGGNVLAESFASHALG